MLDVSIFCGGFGGSGGESIANTDTLEEISSETVQNTAFFEVRVEKASQTQMFSQRFDQKLGRIRPFSSQAAVPGLIPGLSNWTKFCS